MRAYFQCTAVLALGLVLLGGCGGGEPVASGGTGSLNLNLELADGVVINEVAWTISGGDMDPMAGTIDTSAPGTTASVEVSGLPPGEDYLVELEATDESGQVPCEGDAEFDVEVGVVTDVMVMLNCERPTHLGGVRVNGELNFCAQIANVVVSSLQTSVGHAIDISAVGEDVEGDDISYSWTATGGSIADANAQETTYTCEVIGEHDITITVSDDEYCMDEWTVSVTCVDPPECINWIDFPQGVAAGDVDQSSVVLWAKVSIPGPVKFEYGTDPGFVQTDGCVPYNEVEGSDAGVITPAIPAKVEIAGLLDGTQYYYRASRGSCDSAFAGRCKAPGTFRTPHGDGRHGLSFGVSSCFRGDLRPFVSIRNVPKDDPKDNLDFFVALGDTVYADSGEDGCSDVADGDQRVPGQILGIARCHHILAYSQVMSEEDNMFARARASTAFFATIDDHEVVNDFSGGEPPTTPFRDDSIFRTTEPFCNEAPPDDLNCDLAFTNETTAFKEALQAFEEFNPIRRQRYGQTGDPRTATKHKLYRYRKFGKDAALFMLDARSFRDKAQIGLLPFDAYLPTRTMLGSKQLDDLKDDLQDAEDNGITWKFVLVPEPIQNLGPFAATDRFEGYAHERAVILDFIEFNCIRNVVFISGDIHGTIANNLTYRFNRSENYRYSASWDISAGPGAYSPWWAVAPLRPSIPVLNTQLLALRFPRTGLGQDRLHLARMLGQLIIPPRLGRGEVQRWNKDIPATLEPESSYTAVDTFGWTEFEINPETQELTVTTWGVPGYTGAGNVADDEMGNPVVYPSEVSKFAVASVEVAPRCSGCKDNSGLCLLGRDSTCCSGICYAGQCSACKPIDALCLAGDDSTCCSGICYFGQCSLCRPDGDPCLLGDASSCCTGVCDDPPGLANVENRCGACRPADAPCLLGNDAVCCSNSCRQRGLLPTSRRCD